ncbi:hypothetical protein K4F52_009700 [Lecanicillium sp. MT-2017a]|nr:hypothetical protein K4F52_009700 [Lecanicillium sp. MT-2017a]
MKSLGIIATGIATLASVATAAVQGFDISHYQPNVDFKAAYASGARFVIIKACHLGIQTELWSVTNQSQATEGTTYRDPKFSSHYTGATNAGFIRGGYHFARPASSSGAAQANFFLKHGGGWSGDGITLPGMLDMEYNPSGNACYGLSQASMRNWINDFVNTYHGATGRYPLLYTSTSWWKTCTGNTAMFADKCPLVIARYNSNVGELPAGWPFQTIWQYNDHYKYGGDSDSFNGGYSQLQKIATG